MISVRAWGVVLLLLVNAQIFFVNAANPFAIRGAQEVFFVFCILYTFFYVAASFAKSGRIRFDEFFTISVVVCLVFGSAFFAYVKYGQPLSYGFIESRRVFALLVYFPLKSALRKNDNSVEMLIQYILYISVFLWIIAFLMKIGLIAAGSLDMSGDSLRSDRNGMGKYYFVFSYIVSLVNYYKTKNIKWALLAILFIYGVFFITQERQGMLAVALVTFLYTVFMASIKGSIKATFRSFLVVLIVAVVFIFFMEEQRNDVYELLSEVLSESVLESARGRTLNTIWIQLADNYGLPSGALYLYWQDGFHRFYGPNFFLGDVGIFGTIFRLGFLSVPFLGYVFFVLFRSAVFMRSSAIKEIVVLGYAYAFFTLATSGLLEYRGFFLALLYVIAVTERRSMGGGARSDCR